CRVVKIAAFVEELGGFRQDQKTVRETGRYIDLAVVFCRQYCADPQPKMWRTKADIDGHVQDFALDDSAQLGLWSIQLVMKTTQSAPGGTRVVVLDEVIRDAEVSKLGLMIALQEKPARVEKHLG